MNGQRLFITFDEDVTDSRREQILARLKSFQACDVGDQESLFELHIREEVLGLRSPPIDKKAWVAISLHSGAANHRRLYGGGKSQHLAKAVGLDQKKGLQVVDATAGLAGDSFVMACLGAKVIMLERSEILALMIEDALSQAGLQAMNMPELETILSSMSLVNTDALDWLGRQADNSQEVIYLDPMFPERKKKAAVKKEMQLLQALLVDDQIAEEQRLEEEKKLLQTAIAKAMYRVAVKRPRHAPPLEGATPGFSIEGKSTRFDIYPKKKIT